MASCSADSTCTQTLLSETPVKRRRNNISEYEVQPLQQVDSKQENHSFAQSCRLAVRQLLPSTYLRRLLPGPCYRIACYGSWLFWFTIGLLVLRKTENATKAVSYVKTHGYTVSLESIERSEEFAQLIDTLDRDFDRPPAILLLNQHALNMTFNFLCNTKIFSGAHDRFIFVTLDSTARDVLQEYWPNVRQFYWPTPSLYKPFSFAEGPYQTIYLLRANLAIALLKRGKSFWMMQQDTFWRRNLFDLGLEEESVAKGYDALFDQVGDGSKSQRAEWVNGANFFISANNYTLEFFEAIARKLAHWYTPDMGIMIHQCHTWARPRCRFIPHKIAHSWEWMYTEQHDPPHIMQLDCETDGGSKLRQLARFGFYFTKPNGRTCDLDAVKRAQHTMENGRVEVGKRTWLQLSWGRFQFRVYWWLVDYILMTPWFGPFIKPYLPLVGYILMITL
ncbi:nucleotide-diphospho-sugar transferase domain-containing protein [Ditylenchus destructor]|uniref:Nucleotide-diphospho-sugar transferase domain-containing protein n=1 Tax=Ditylenchus destructor TaxID=166010 RepID=A0AAD4NC59_9BILA|nr:nucleotide-diphospho-sugar transferase domain-containing protein [Ditylenchus destructor]